MTSSPPRLSPPLHGTVIHAPDPPDSILALQGDADSFMQLHQRYAAAVYRYLAARVDAHSAEEVTALAFERAWHSLPRYQASGSFAGWLFTIVHRTLIDYYRHTSVQHRHSTTLDETIRDPQAQPEAVALQREQNQALLQALESLPAEQQELIRLRFLADLPYSTIATIVGKKQAAVKMMTYRALETLKRRMPHDDAST
jgi:RNA polymerase sigma factor (sigma-70 family)